MDVHVIHVGKTGRPSFTYVQKYGRPCFTLEKNWTTMFYLMYKNMDDVQLFPNVKHGRPYFTKYGVHVLHKPSKTESTF